MTQYVINIGAIPNDGTGDPLRTAFNETNLNFDQVFAAGPVLSNIQIANNRILTTNTNGNLVLAPNGTGVILANVSIVPNLANLRNLGSSTQRWATVYTQYLNVSSGTSVNGNLTVDGNLIVMGNVINMGNIVTDTLTIQLANTTTTANAANGAGITVGANDDIATLLYSNTANAWTTNVGISTTGNVTTGNVLPGGYISAVGNIRGGNINTTGGVSAVELRVGATANSWRINGNILTAPSGAFWQSDPITLDEYISSAPDGYIDLISRYANGSTASQVHLEHGLAQIVVDNGSEYIWSFDDAGSLTAPGSITANYFLGNIEGTSGNISGLTASNFDVVNISARDSSGVNIGAGGYNNLVVLPTDVLIQNVPLTVAGNILSTVAGGLNITANTVANGTAQIWNFGTDGRLTFPGTPRIDTGSNNFEVQAAESINFEANAVVNIYTDTSGTTYQWQFGNNGNLTVPGNIVMPSASALVGDLGSPAPSISGFNSISAITLSASGNVTGNLIGTATTAASLISGNSGVEFAAPGANVEITVGGVGIVNISSDTVGVTGNVTVGNVQANSRVITTPVVLANLTAVAGARAFVSDGNLVASGNFGAQIGSGGSNTVPVWSDGTNWYVG